jgi:hypothetical protein
VTAGSLRLIARRRRPAVANHARHSYKVSGGGSAGVGPTAPVSPTRYGGPRTRRGGLTRTHTSQQKIGPGSQVLLRRLADPRHAIERKL